MYESSFGWCNLDIPPKFICLYIYYSFLSCPIVLIFCTEHSSITAVLCAKLQNDWVTEIDIMDEQDFKRFWIWEEFQRATLYCNKSQASNILLMWMITHTYMTRNFQKMCMTQTPMTIFSSLLTITPGRSAITMHLLSIQRADSLKLHDMFNARDANLATVFSSRISS